MSFGGIMINTILTWAIIGAVVLFLLFILAVVVGTVIRFGNDYPGLEDVEP